MDRFSGSSEGMGSPFGLVFAPASNRADEPAAAAVDELFSDDMFMPDNMAFDIPDDQKSEASMSSYGGASTPNLGGRSQHEASSVGGSSGFPAGSAAMRPLTMTQPAMSASQMPMGVSLQPPVAGRPIAANGSQPMLPGQPLLPPGVAAPPAPGGTGGNSYPGSDAESSGRQSSRIRRKRTRAEIESQQGESRRSSRAGRAVETAPADARGLPSSSSSSSSSSTNANTATGPQQQAAAALAMASAGLDPEEAKGLSFAERAVLRAEREAAQKSNEELGDIDDQDEDGNGADGQPARKSRRKATSPAERLARSRERNRIHARKSRLRKKYFLESLKCSLETLEEENQGLRSFIQARLGKPYEHFLQNPQAAPAQVQTTAGPSSSSSSSSSSAAPVPAPTHTPGSSVVARSAEEAERAVKIDSGDYRLVQALEQAQQNFVVSDPNLPDNPIVFASRGFYELTGYSPAEVIGKNCRFLQGPETDPESIATIRRGIQQGKDVGVTLVNYRKDGTPFYNSFFVAPLTGIDGRIVNYIGVQCEVSESVAKATMRMQQQQKAHLARQRQRQVAAQVGAAPGLMGQVDLELGPAAAAVVASSSGAGPVPGMQPATALASQVVAEGSMAGIPADIAQAAAIADAEERQQREAAKAKAESEATAAGAGADDGSGLS